MATRDSTTAPTTTAADIRAAVSRSADAATANADAAKAAAALAALPTETKTVTTKVTVYTARGVAGFPPGSVIRDMPAAEADELIRRDHAIQGDATIPGLANMDPAELERTAEALLAQARAARAAQAMQAAPATGAVAPGSVPNPANVGPSITTDSNSGVSVTSTAPTGTATGTGTGVNATPAQV